MQPVASSLRARLAAFVLQWQEACLIHISTGLSERYGFDVKANERDELVTLGAIPDEAILEAQETRRMPCAVLTEKPCA